MALVVQKYGGTSLATPKHIQRAAERIAGLKSSGCEVVVVVSAMGHTTDHLLKLASKTVKTPPLRELDMLLTAGERVSMSLLAMCLHEKKIPAISFTGSQSGIITTEVHSQAKILEIKADRIKEELGKGKVAIVAGFQGVSRNREITTLGRGGSDTTAVALAAVLKADRCEILTDVQGIFSADPRIVPQARLFSDLSYERCLQLSLLGAKMHPRSIELAKRFKVPLVIGLSQLGDKKGTRVGFLDSRVSKSEENEMEEPKINAVIAKDGFHFVKVSQDLVEVSRVFQKREMSLEFYSSHGGTTYFVCPDTLISDLKEEFRDQIDHFLESVSIVSVVGESVSSANSILPRLLATLKKCQIEPFMTGSRLGAFSVAIATSEKEKATQALHQEFVRD